MINLEPETQGLLICILIGIGIGIGLGCLLGIKIILFQLEKYRNELSKGKTLEK